MAEKFLYPYAVNADFIDSKLRFTLIGMISLAQTAVSFHFGENRLSIPHVSAAGKTWVVSKQHFEISEYPLWKDEFASVSWMEPPKGPFFYYDFAYSYFADGGKKRGMSEPLRCLSARDAENTPLSSTPFCKANAMWLLLDLATLRPTKAADADFSGFEFCNEQLFPQKFPKLVPSANWHMQHEFTPRAQEIDLNGHVNNVEYVRYLLNWLPADVASGMLVKTLDTAYISSAHIDDTLVCRSAVLPASDSADATTDEKTVLHSIVRADGSEVFRARTVWAPETRMSRDVRL